MFYVEGVLRGLILTGRTRVLPKPNSWHHCTVYTMSVNTSRARVYSDVNVHRPRDYWDYESHVIEWG